MRIREWIEKMRIKREIERELSRGGDERESGEEREVMETREACIHSEYPMHMCTCRFVL